MIYRVIGHDNINAYEVTNWMENIAVEKLTGAELVKKFTAFHEPRGFFTVFATACHWFLS
jgi:hypothetical protein